MSKAQFAPALSIIALAGSKEAGIEAAFNALHKGVACIIGHGDKRTLTDTLQALTQCKGTQAKRVTSCVQAAYDAGMLQKLAGKGEADKGAARADAITQKAADAYAADCETAASTRAEKAAVTKAAKEKAGKEAEKTAKAAEHAQRLTLGDAVAFLCAALASGSVDAGLHLDALVSDFYTTETAPTAGEIVGEAREVGVALALTH